MGNRMGEVTVEQRFHGTVALTILHLRRLAKSNDIDAGFAAAHDLTMIGPEHEAFMRNCLAIDEAMQAGLKSVDITENFDLIGASLVTLTGRDGSFDLEHLSLMEEMDFTALMQAVHHHAETVFVYRINSAHDIGRDYRSTELFPVRATLLYSRLAPYSDRDHGAVRLLELWMLTDGSFAVVANM